MKPARNRAKTGSIAARAPRKRSAESRSYSRRALVLGERNGIGDLVGRAVEARRKIVPIEHRDQPLVERGDASSIERKLLAPAVADPQHDRVAAKIERQRERAAAARLGREIASPRALGWSATCQP